MEEILFTTAHVWVTVLYFKTLSEIPGCATEAWITNINTMEKKSAKKAFVL